MLTALIIELHLFFQQSQHTYLLIIESMHIAYIKKGEVQTKSSF
jgi:hypothetical protein